MRRPLASCSWLAWLAAAVVLTVVSLSGATTPPVARAASPEASALPMLEASGTVLKAGSGDGPVVNLRGTNAGSWLLREGWMSPIGEAWLPTSGWRSSASSTGSGESSGNAIDARKQTRWSTGAAQKPGQTFTLDLGSATTFDAVQLDVGDSTGDYPRGLTVSASNDGSSWQTLVSDVVVPAGSTVKTNYTTARYVRLTQTRSAANWWSIAELHVLVSDEFNFRRVLNDRFGTATADGLIDAYQDSWLQESDLDRMQALGFNYLRVPVDWQMFKTTDGKDRSDTAAFQALDWVIDQAGSRGIYVLIDLHGAPGGACPWHSCGRAGSNQLWTSTTYQNWTVQIWQRIASRYAGNTAVAGYDLLNEPLVSNGAYESTAEVAKKFAFLDRLYRAIRGGADPDHLIVIPAFYDWGTSLPPSKFGWTNVMYETHHYDFGEQFDRDKQRAFATQAVNDIVEHQESYDVPVLAGEFWFGGFTDVTSGFLKSLNASNVSWSNWTWKNMNPADGRNPDGVQNGYNWSFYDSADAAVPDINTDSADELRQAWAGFTTAHFQPNADMQTTFKDAASPARVRLPATIQAESLNESSGGLLTEPASDSGGGLDLGWWNRGDWSEYDVTVPAAGSYRITMRVSSPAGASNAVVLSRAGGPSGAAQTVPRTGGWQRWTTISTTLQLPSGQTSLRLTAANEGFNVNWLKVEPL